MIAMIAATLLLATGEAHMNLMKPTPWIGNTLFPGSQCAYGCDGTAPGQTEEGVRYCACEWYTNDTFIPDNQETTIYDTALRTYMDGPFGDDWTARHPWRAPGTAQILSPCGIDGGNPTGCPAGNPQPDGCAGGGYGYGPDALTFAFKEKEVTQWSVGSEQDVHFGITANQ